MTNRNKKLSILAALILTVTISIIFVLKDKPANTNMKAQSTKADESSADDKVSQPTIATEWQWQEPNEEKTQEPESNTSDVALPFTAKSVHDALQAVKVDTDGNIILDHDALISLDEALERIHNKLDSESLRSLQDIITNALPGKVGQQTAQLVGDYHQFLQAKQEFSQIHEGLPANAKQTLASIESDQALYAELHALRELHLGTEVANSLFNDSNANANFMFDSMKLELENTLTPEERESRRLEIETRYKAQTGTN